MLFSFPSDLMTKYFLFLMSNEIFLRLTGTLPGVECELINGEAAVARLALQVDPEVPVGVDGDLTNQRRLTRSRDQLSTNHSSPGQAATRAAQCPASRRSDTTTVVGHDALERYFYLLHRFISTLRIDIVSFHIQPTEVWFSSSSSLSAAPTGFLRLDMRSFVVRI